MFRVATVASSLLILLTACSNEKTRALRSLNQKGIPLQAEQVTKAVSAGDEETLRHLLACGVSPLQCDAEGRSPLQLATNRSDYRSAQLLIQAGAPVDDGSDAFPCPLAAAAINGDIPIAKALLEKGANPNVTMPKQGPLLVWCIAQGRYNIAQAMLTHGADPHLPDPAGNSALSYAVHRQQRALTELLLEKGADPGKASKNPAALKPIVIRCLELGWHELIPTLVKKGADLRAQTAEGKTAVDYALESGKPEIFTMLVTLGADNGEQGWDARLGQSLAQNNLRQLHTLLKAGIKPSAKQTPGPSLLHVALEKNQTDAVKLLLEHQFPLGTAYHLACERGNFEAVKMFESYNAKTPSAALDPFDSPLHCAIRSGKHELVLHLLSKGAKVDELGKEKQMPLVCAIARRQPEIVKSLLLHKADPNKKLEPAANEAFLALIEGNGMKWYLRKDRNITPLMLAADSGNLEVAKTLLEHGASISAWTSVNKTWPLNFASRKNDVPMMRLLLNKDPLKEERKIVVSLASQRATLFNAAGETIYTTKISSGKKGFSTPTGTYVITNKYRDWKSTIYDGASMPSFQRLSCSDFGFHQGVVPGYPASHGCLRVPAGNAQKLFSLTQLGDRVIIE